MRGSVRRGGAASMMRSRRGMRQQVDRAVRDHRPACPESSRRAVAGVRAGARQEPVSHRNALQ
jgi:hypothetical protein